MVVKEACRAAEMGSYKKAVRAPRTRAPRARLEQRQAEVVWLAPPLAVHLAQEMMPTRTAGHMSGMTERSQEATRHRMGTAYLTSREPP